MIDVFAWIVLLILVASSRLDVLGVDRRGAGPAAIFTRTG